MEVSMKMPDLSTTGSAVRVIRWLAEIGQPIRRGQPLMEIETDKAITEVESVVTGVLKSVSVHADQDVFAGQLIAVFEAGSTLP